MTVIDTSLLIERISEGKRVDENVCMISIIEHPAVLEYARFQGEILYPGMEEFELALELQRRLRARGRMKGSSDLIIAATCIIEGESLLTLDKDYEEIGKVSNLQVVLG